MNIGIVGIGYWGPNLVRIFDSITEIKKIVACDLRQDRLDFIKRVCPRVKVTKNFDELLVDPSIDAIVISTWPLSTHFSLAKRVIESKKHVFVEKPITSTSKEASELITLAKQNNVLLHVDHTYEYSAPVVAIKEIIANGELGEILSINSERLNLGIFQNDFNVVWDLCPHDFSILNFWLDKTPTSIYATGTCHINKSIEDDVHILFKYGANLDVHIHVGWLHPQKTRLMTIIGTKKMLVYNDLEPEEKIKIYDKGVLVNSTSKNVKYSYKQGAVFSPNVKVIEPLLEECSNFIDCVEKKIPTKTSGESGLKVVRMIEETIRAMKEKREIEFHEN